MATKARPAKVKAGEERGLQPGEFEALVSVFGTTDSVNDRVMPGAFQKSLAEWGERGDPIPVIWTHSHGDAFSYVGEAAVAKETDEGLLIKGRLDIEPEAENPTARQVYRLLKGGRVRNWSFAYEIEDAVAAKDGANELRQLRLYEVGPTLIGAHQGTRTLAVKHDPQTEPEPTSEADPEPAEPELVEQVQAAIETLTDVLARLQGESEQETAQPTAPAKDETAPRKSEEPTPMSPADLLTFISTQEQE